MRRLTALALLVALAPAAAAQYSGSVYTTDAKANVENVFGKPRDVYMAGGPGPNAGCSGNGLPDGSYYFQVTDPSGSTLLSTDPLADRAVIVSDGVISAAGSRSTRNGPCGSEVVQLVPFAPTPNSSGEYKVWLIPASDYVPGGPNHGFPSDASKTDNFKVRGGGKPIDQALIEGYVFYDIDENGVYDPSVSYEVPLSGWRIEIESDGEVDVIFTDVDGHYEFIRDAGTTHVLTSVAPAPGYVGTVGGRWWGTNPTEVTVTANLPATRTDFGLLYFINTPDLALSKGYWHKQGESILAANDPEWREVVNGLCLRKNITIADGYTEEETRFYVTETGSFSEAFQQLSDFLVGENLGVIANNLSVQFCAAVLNKSFGNLQVTTFLDEFDDDILVEFGTIVETSRDLLCDPRSADTGPFGDSEWRDILKEHLSVNVVADWCRALIPEWSGMNSDGGNIYTRDQVPPDYLSPYN
jgi:hypothetical protein